MAGVLGMISSGGGGSGSRSGSWTDATTEKNRQNLFLNLYNIPQNSVGCHLKSSQKNFEDAIKHYEHAEWGNTTALNAFKYFQNHHPRESYELRILCGGDNNLEVNLFFEFNYTNYSDTHKKFIQDFIKLNYGPTSAVTGFTDDTYGENWKSDLSEDLNHENKKYDYTFNIDFDRSTPYIKIV